MKNIKLKSIVESFLEEDEPKKITSEDKVKFVEAIKNFNTYSDSIYRESISDLVEEISELVSSASELTLTELDDSFDKITLKRHMKGLGESLKVFTETAKEMTSLQQRFEASFDDIGTTLNKYYQIGESIDDLKREEKRKLQKENRHFRFESKSNVNWKAFYKASKDTSGYDPTYEKKYKALLDQPHIADALSTSKDFNSFMKFIKQFESITYKKNLIEAYNGWSNQDTWHANLWLTDDKSTSDDLEKTKNASAVKKLYLNLFGKNHDGINIAKVDWQEIYDGK